MDKYKILIIEDTLTYQQALKRECQESGYEVECALTGEEGLSLIKSSLPDLIILDLNLPDYDGREICKRMKQNFQLQLVPIMILTMDNEEDVIKDGFESGADSIVSKKEPFDIIVSRIQSLLRLSQASRSIDKSSSINQLDQLDLKSKKILIIDDDITFLHALKRHLVEKKYQVIAIEDAKKCFALIEKENFDLILIDLKMPDIDGADVARQLRKFPEYATMPILMLTASESTEDIKRSFDSGVSDYIIKSGDFTALDYRITYTLKRKHYETEHFKIRKKLLDTEVELRIERAEKESREKYSREL